jgi:uncharacterized repeat protein (TIGR01451 family)
MALTGLLLRTISGEELRETSNHAILDQDDPIAFIGHGAMFDLQGNEIEPTLDLLQEAQEYYSNKLSFLATPEQRAQLESKQAALFSGTELSTQRIMIVNSALIDWLIGEVQLNDAGATQGKNNLIKSMIQDLYSTDADYFLNGDSELNVLLNSQGLIRPHVPESDIQAEREDYLEQCKVAGVPRPPDWDLTQSQWMSTGVLYEADLFIGADLTAAVYVSKTDAPLGVCIANPRARADIVQLLGIICLGKESGNACFWDNQEDDMSKPFPLTNTRAITDFAGGPELYGGWGGICTDCHSGENPFPIHTNTNLDPLQFREKIGWTIADLQLFQPDTWYRPIVSDLWPQNPGPITLTNPPTDRRCTTCHIQNGPREFGFGAGRFPEFSGPHGADEGDSRRPGRYCATILEDTIYRTMPPGPPLYTGDYGHIRDYSAQISALLNECPQPLGPVAQSTISVDASSAANQTLTYIVAINNHFPIAANVTADTVTVTNTLDDNLTLLAATVEFEKTSGVTETADPQVSENGITWYGALESSSQLTITYEAGFDYSAARSSFINDVSIEDGIAPQVSISATAGPFYFTYIPLIGMNGPVRNNPPNTPSNPSPADNVTGVSVSTDLNWTGGDPDGDSVTYDVYFEANDSTPDHQLPCNDVVSRSCACNSALPTTVSTRRPARLLFR